MEDVSEVVGGAPALWWWWLVSGVEEDGEVSGSAGWAGGEGRRGLWEIRNSSVREVARLGERGI